MKSETLRELLWLLLICILLALWYYLYFGSPWDANRAWGCEIPATAPADSAVRPADASEDEPSGHTCAEQLHMWQSATTQAIDALAEKVCPKEHGRLSGAVDLAGFIERCLQEAGHGHKRKEVWQ